MSESESAVSSPAEVRVPIPAMEWSVADGRMARSASLPSLAGGGLSCVGLDSGLDSEAASEAGCRRPARRCSRGRTVAATMAQHYYPEGGWGWAVVLCHALLNLLLHGLQSGYGLLAGSAQQQFRPTPVALGEWGWCAGRVCSAAVQTDTDGAG